MAEGGMEAAIQGTWGNGNSYPMAKRGVEAAIQGTWNGNGYPMAKGGVEAAIPWLKGNGSSCLRHMWEWEQLSHG